MCVTCGLIEAREIEGGCPCGEGRGIEAMLPTPAYGLIAKRPPLAYTALSRYR